MMMNVKRFWVLCGVLLCGLTGRAQFLDGTTGLLQMPSADMHEGGTAMVFGNFLDPHTNSTHWDYNTLAYGANIAFFNRFEFSYICVLHHAEYTRYGIPVSLRDQDRHFAAKFLLLREGEFGWTWLPALAVGVSDPADIKSFVGYIDAGKKAGSGYFSRLYAVATKHFQTPWGQLGAHAGWQYNRRTDFPLNGPCAGLDWRPVWLQAPWLDLDVVAEYDARTFNVGFIAGLWDRVEVMFDLQSLRWVSFGVRYKINLL